MKKPLQYFIAWILYRTRMQDYADGFDSLLPEWWRERIWAACKVFVGLPKNRLRTCYLPKNFPPPLGLSGDFQRN